MKKVSVIAPASSRVNSVGALAVINMPREIRSRNRTSKARQPNSPNSSANTANTKSVVRSGMKSRWVCVPFNQPLPNQPPEPTAIVDWIVW